MMLSSSPSSFSPPFLSSSPPLSPTSPPPHARLAPPISAAASASCSYTWTEEPPRLRQSPRRVSVPQSASLYEILEVPIGATSREIKAAYRRLARICHPDVAGIDRENSSADEFMRIHAAYCTLLDPDKRAVYDRRIRQRSRPMTTAGTSGFGRYGGRNWETDQCW
ncbi:PREDICTED: chaperone protein dnaJ 11, chloroplastic-like [Tarenaya hassleriana]|uniref:chaperone protein dnaJ 11, chloroplastic-like n=1 Tax=Tarenaya hassleriana TaxID=28532 RepID=UPI00053C17EF|nr:PREDICTED: chaperone protein dnaJ 11, chloroplastic-like [Tarenaya hassleriana]